MGHNRNAGCLAAEPAKGSADRTAGQDLPLIDRAHLSRQTFGDEALQREVLDLFATQVVAVQQALEAETDLEGRARFYHLLKGGAAGVGAFALAERAQACEAAPHDERCLTQLVDVIGKTLDQLRAIHLV